MPSQPEPSTVTRKDNATPIVEEAALSNDIAASQVAAAGTAQEDPDSLFHFGFSQMPGLIQGLSEEVRDTSMASANSSDEHFALNFSQVIDTQAMTQI